MLTDSVSRMNCVLGNTEDVVVGIGIGGEYPTGSVAVGS